eukprot:Sspe_Gene.103158::Locus_78975_Transcript_1_1_Confidence_1.000_Length_1724::g.103158::m.103158
MEPFVHALQAVLVNGGCSNCRIPAAMCARLLKDAEPLPSPPADIPRDDVAPTTDLPPSVVAGVPECPLYRPLGSVLHRWGTEGSLQLRFAEVPLLEDHPDLVSELNEKFCSVEEDVVCAVTSQDDEQRHEALSRVIAGLGPFGVLRLLGCRATVATKSAICDHGVWPPDRSELLARFSDIYCSKLTVGAKALAKHTVRHKDWWGGDLKGGEEAKSALAYKVVNRIVSNAAWINLHLLPHSIPVFEVRVKEGYGARWVFEENDGKPQELRFRGFLEPQCADGHENRWRH